MSVAEATEFITHQSGQQFDPAVVKAFRARTDSLVAILKQQRAQQPQATPVGDGKTNVPPPLAGEGRVGADRVLEKAS
jgi:hypothetical protein